MRKKIRRYVFKKRKKISFFYWYFGRLNREESREKDFDMLRRLFSNRKWSCIATQRRSIYDLIFSPFLVLVDRSILSHCIPSRLFFIFIYLKTM